jgi:ligand-binding SRPBCC domain-containing protein
MLDQDTNVCWVSTLRYEWSRKDSLSAVNDSKDIHSALWMTIQTFTPRYEWQSRHSLRAMNDSPYTHSALWMTIQTFIPRYEWQSRHSLRAMNAVHTFTPRYEWQSRHSLRAMNDSPYIHFALWMSVQTYIPVMITGTWRRNQHKKYTKNFDPLMIAQRFTRQAKVQYKL